MEVLHSSHISYHLSHALLLFVLWSRPLSTLEPPHLALFLPFITIRTHTATLVYA